MRSKIGFNYICLYDKCSVTEPAEVLLKLASGAGLTNPSTSSGTDYYFTITSIIVPSSEFSGC
ncbi:MAG: hypothetical protein GX762_09195 [Bacteroidales bacterium]|nr:hypothetical protein [Bacteroidales bacterium]